MERTQFVEQTVNKLNLTNKVSVAVTFVMWRLHNTLRSDLLNSDNSTVVRSIRHDKELSVTLRTVDSKTLGHSSHQSRPAYQWKSSPTRTLPCGIVASSDRCGNLFAIKNELNGSLLLWHGYLLHEVMNCEASWG